MASISFLLLAAALGVLMVNHGAHGGVAGPQRHRRWSSLRTDADPQEWPMRFRRQLNLPDDPSANTGSIDDLIVLGPIKFSEPAGDNQRSIVGDNQRSIVVDNQRSIVVDNQRSTGGDYQRSTGGDNQRSTGGDNQRSTGGDNQRSTGGDNQRSTGGDNQRSTGGDHQRSTGGDNQRSTGGDNQRSIGGGHQPFGGGNRVPQLQAPPDITRTFLPTDPRFGPSTEVITVGKVPGTVVTVTNTVPSTTTIRVVSTTTVTSFTVLISTVTTGVFVEQVTSTVALEGECSQPPLTYYTQIPADITTVTVYQDEKSHEKNKLVDHVFPSTSYFDSVSDHGNMVTRTNYKEADVHSTLANVNLQSSSFTTPRTRPTLTMPGDEYATGYSRNGSPSTDASSSQVTEEIYHYTAPPVKFMHGPKSRQDLKKINKRSAKDFVNDYYRTMLNY